jgi:hypothetical protein
MREQLNTIKSLAFVIVIVLFMASCGESVDPNKANAKLVMKAITEFNTAGCKGSSFRN